MPFFDEKYVARFLEEVEQQWLTLKDMNKDEVLQVKEGFQFYSTHPCFARLAHHVVRVPGSFPKYIFVVPRDFVFKVPKSKKGKLAKVYAMHQFMYRRLGLSKDKREIKLQRKIIDRLLLEALEVIGVNPFIRTLTYWAVRIFGAKYLGK